MSDLGPYPFLLLAMVIVIVMIALSGRATAPNRPPELPRHCPGCRTLHPTYARFCRRCGRRLIT